MQQPTPSDPSHSLEESHEWRRLHRQVRALRLVTLGLCATVGVAVLLGMHSGQPNTPPEQPTKFREITVERINIAGPDGVRRYIISHDAPKAPFAGRELERSVPPGMAALLMLDGKGNEVGGYASSNSHALLSLDYRDFPLEAVGLAAWIGPDGGQSAGIVVNQPPTGAALDMDAVMRGVTKSKEPNPDANDPDIRELARFQAMQLSRIEIGASTKGAGITLNDSQGRKRILLNVAEDGTPEIVLYDAAGKETARLPK